MQTSARDAYLYTQVMTAAPQKLHLMLIESAIRCCTRGKQCWASGEEEEALATLSHAEEILGELLSSVGASEHELARKLAAVYLYTFRLLTESLNERSGRKLDDVLRILEIKRETWSEVCKKFGGELQPEQAPAQESRPTPAAEAPASPAPVAFDLNTPATGFSFEA